MESSRSRGRERGRDREKGALHLPNCPPRVYLSIIFLSFSVLLYFSLDFFTYFWIILTRYGTLHSLTHSLRVCICVSFPLWAFHVLLRLYKHQIAVPTLRCYLLMIFILFCVFDAIFIWLFVHLSI